MDMWQALQYVGTGLSLVAFIVAALLLAYRARLTNRAEIIKSAPEKERLDAIATTAEFFRVDVSGLTRVQQQDIALTQIQARTRRDLLLAGVSLAVAILLAAIAIAAIWASKTAGPPSVVNPSGPVIGAGRDITGPVNIGLDEKQVAQRVAEALKPLTDQQEKLAIQVARDKGIEVAPLRAILVKMGEVGVRDEDIPGRLSEKADELIRLREEIARLRRGPVELASFAEQAETLINKGELDGARIVLAAGRTAARSLREQSSRYEADFLAQEAKVDHLQLAYGAAAMKYAEAASLIAALDRRKQWQFVSAQANEWRSQGDEFGDNAALAEAIKVYRESLLLAPRAQQPFDWATTQDNLGVALWTLGGRESGTARLEEAVAAYRDALKERTRERVPLDWATTQNNLGNAFQTLGRRESGTARLEEAVAAYRDALKERARERVPLDWAMTQNNLGGALQTLGERESGTARLEEAVTAYSEALKELTRERVPLQWAAIQNNLGSALQTLGGRENGTARLEEAVVAYRDALKERTHERVPLDWATTQNNLGNALATLGGRESGTARLEEAVVAYRDALKESTRERVPLRWAATQNNLGSALQDLGERESGTARLEEAVTAYSEALKELTRERVPLQWAATQNNLGSALQDLGERESGTARLEEAVAAYRDALKERARERVPLDWAMSFGNQGIAMIRLAERTKDVAMAATACQQIEAALGIVRSAGHVPLAAYFESRLPEARQIRDTLNVP
jgi:tetratricopeptide (TPR) repeat protein